MKSEVEILFAELSNLKMPTYKSRKKWVLRLCTSLNVSLAFIFLYLLILLVIYLSDAVRDSFSIALIVFISLVLMFFSLAFFLVGLSVYDRFFNGNSIVIRKGEISDECVKKLYEFNMGSLEKAQIWLQAEIDESNRHRNFLFGGAVSLFGIFELLTKNTDVSYQTLWDFSGGVLDLGLPELLSALQFFMLGLVVGALISTYLSHRLEQQKFWVDRALLCKQSH